MNPNDQQPNQVPAPEVPQPPQQPAQPTPPVMPQQPVQPGVVPPPQPGMVPLQPVVPGQPVVQPAPVAGMPPQPPVAADGKKSKKKILILAGVGVLFLLAIGVIAALSLMNPRYSTSDLTTTSSNGTKFSYPKKWQKITWTDTDIAYGDGNDLEHSHAAIGAITSDAPFETPPFSSLASEERQPFADAIGSGLKSGVKSNEDFSSNCKGDINVVTSDSFVDADMLGSRVLVECTKNENGEPVYILARVGYGKDDKVHTLLISALKKVWTKNENFFKTVESSLGIE